MSLIVAMWVNSNSLIKDLTPFEDDAEIRLLQIISTLKFLSNWNTMFWVISQDQYSIKTLEFTETNSYFYSFTYEEKNIFSSSFILPVGRCFCEFVGRQKSCGFNSKIFSACLRYKQGFYFFSLNKIQIVNSILRSTKLSLTR